MGEYTFKDVDFDHPSFLFSLEDILKNIIGEPLFYLPYIKTFGLRGDENILDFGCGGGTGSKSLLKFLNGNGHLTCVDTSTHWIEKAEKRLCKYPNVECLVGDIRDLAIPNNYFDVITIIHVIHDIEPSVRQDTVNVLSQKLKQEGSLFIREPIKKKHGMAVREIRTLFNHAGLWEFDQEINQSEYKGRFLKNEN